MTLAYRSKSSQNSALWVAHHVVAAPASTTPASAPTVPPPKPDTPPVLEAAPPVPTGLPPPPGKAPPLPAEAPPPPDPAVWPPAPELPPAFDVAPPAPAAGVAEVNVSPEQPHGRTRSAPSAQRIEGRTSSKTSPSPKGRQFQPEFKGKSSESRRHFEAPASKRIPPFAGSSDPRATVWTRRLGDAFERPTGEGAFLATDVAARVLHASSSFPIRRATHENMSDARAARTLATRGNRARVSVYESCAAGPSVFSHARRARGEFDLSRSCALRGKEKRGVAIDMYLPQWRSNPLKLKRVTRVTNEPNLPLPKVENGPIISASVRERLTRTRGSMDQVFDVRHSQWSWKMTARGAHSIGNSAERSECRNRRRIRSTNESLRGRFSAQRSPGRSIQFFASTVRMSSKTKNAMPHDGSIVAPRQ